VRKPEGARFCPACNRKHGRYTRIRKEHRRSLRTVAAKTGTRRMPLRVWRPGWSRRRFGTVVIGGGS
jgi:hypothetical protein